MSPDVSIVIVTYRCRDEVLACLASIYQGTDGVSFEIVVVDNASGDGTVEAIRSEFEDVRLLELPENVGFAAGVNVGAGLGSGEYLLLLNPDSVVHDGAVRELVEFARLSPRHGIYGGRTLWPDGTLCPGSCWGRPSVWSLFCFATLLSTALKGSRVFDPESLGGWQRDSVREVDIVTGCLLLIPATLWEELGGFDTRFFMYGEDADLSLRASALGRRPAITPRAVTTHEVGVSSASRGDKLILLFTGKATLVRKHWGPFRRRLGLALLWLGVGVRAVGGLVRSPVARRSGWIAVWKARRTWMRGYAYRESAAASTAELSVTRHAPPRG